MISIPVIKTVNWLRICIFVPKYEPGGIISALWRRNIAWQGGGTGNHRKNNVFSTLSIIFRQIDFAIDHCDEPNQVA